MMRLHLMPGSCALSAHIALEWAGAAYEPVSHPRSDMGSDAYRLINPKGQVPALELDDGAVITEAFAVLLYIADAFPEAELAPRSGIERIRLYERLAELTSGVHPAFAPMFAPQRFIDERDLQAKVKAAAQQRIEAQFNRLNEQLDNREWLLDRRSVADAYLYALTRWKASMTEHGLQNLSNVARHKAAMESDPAVQSAVKQEGLSL